MIINIDKHDSIKAMEYIRSVVTKKVLLLVPVLFSSLGITGGGFQSGLGVSSSSPPSSSTACNEKKYHIQ